MLGKDSANISVLSFVFILNQFGVTLPSNKLTGFFDTHLSLHSFVYRPKTSRIYPSRDDAGCSTYQSDFRGKSIPQEESFRTGSASGNRRNNPHPSEVF